MKLRDLLRLWVRNARIGILRVDFSCCHYWADQESQTNFFLGTFAKHSIKKRHIKFAPFYMVSNLNFRRAAFKVWISTVSIKGEQKTLHSFAKIVKSASQVALDSLCTCMVWFKPFPFLRMMKQSWRRLPWKDLWIINKVNLHIRID
jgi:hypothetical protein